MKKANPLFHAVPPTRRASPMPPADRVRFDHNGGTSWTAFTKTFSFNPWRQGPTFEAPATAGRAELVEAWGDALAAID